MALAETASIFCETLVLNGSTRETTAPVPEFPLGQLGTARASELSDEQLTKAGFIPEHDPQRWLDERAARGDGKCHVIDGGNKLFVSGTTPAPGPGKELPYCAEDE